MKDCYWLNIFGSVIVNDVLFLVEIEIGLEEIVKIDVYWFLLFVLGKFNLKKKN